MTKEELISHYCDYRGKCTSDDVAALTFAYRMLTPRWISVEDELPKGVINDNVTKMVLTFSADGYIRLDRYMHYYHRWVNGASEVTHWQHLPAPPKKGGEHTKEEIKGNQGKISPNRIIGTEEHIKVALDVMEKGGEQ